MALLVEVMEEVVVEVQVVLLNMEVGE